PPSRTRTQPGLPSFMAEDQTAPSASRQMPSLPWPSSAHMRRFDRLPSAAMSNAVSLLPVGVDDRNVQAGRDGEGNGRVEPAGLGRGRVVDPPAEIGLEGAEGVDDLLP